MQLEEYTANRQEEVKKLYDFLKLSMMFVFFP